MLLASPHHIELTPPCGIDPVQGMAFGFGHSQFTFRLLHADGTTPVDIQVVVEPGTWIVLAGIAGLIGLRKFGLR
jgi:hypothetical protein